MEIRTEHIRFASTKTISHACHLANNLYNEAKYGAAVLLYHRPIDSLYYHPLASEGCQTIPEL
ncbi:MAG: hypothetical protein ACFFB3_00905 [Candidatus Hodarchaeota archaeon]